MTSYEQQARDLMERCGDEAAQGRTAADVCELANLLVEVERLQKELARYQTLVYLLRDEEPCRLDHRGACQEHDWLMFGIQCPHATARAVLPDNFDKVRPFPLHRWADECAAKKGEDDAKDHD